MCWQGAGPGCLCIYYLIAPAARLLTTNCVVRLQSYNSIAMNLDFALITLKYAADVVSSPSNYVVMCVLNAGTSSLCLLAAV